MTPVLNSWLKIERSESESGSFLCGPEISCRGKKNLVGSVYLSSLVSGLLEILDTDKFLSVLKISLA